MGTAFRVRGGGVLKSAAISWIIRQRGIFFTTHHGSPLANSMICLEEGTPGLQESPSQRASQRNRSLAECHKKLRFALSMSESSGSLPFAFRPLRWFGTNGLAPQVDSFFSCIDGQNMQPMVWLLSLPIVCDSLWFQVANKYGWWMMLTSRPRSGLFLYKGPLPLSKAHIKAVEAIRRSEISTPEKPHAAVSGPKRYQCKGAVISVRLPGRRNKALNWPHIWTSLI